MINYREDLKKFEPCLDVDQAEDAIYSDDLKDVEDLINEIKKDIEEEK